MVGTKHKGPGCVISVLNYRERETKGEGCERASRGNT